MDPLHDLEHYIGSIIDNVKNIENVIPNVLERMFNITIDMQDAASSLYTKNLLKKPKIPLLF